MAAPHVVNAVPAGPTRAALKGRDLVREPRNVEQNGVGAGQRRQQAEE
jgi:hypothetical protein